MRAVYIAWFDACNGDPGWQFTSEIVEFAGRNERLCHSFGIVISDSEQWITIAQTSGDNQYNGTIKIYKKMVQEIIEIPPIDQLRLLNKKIKRKRK